MRWGLDGSFSSIFQISLDDLGALSRNEEVGGLALCSQRSGTEGISSASVSTDCRNPVRALHAACFNGQSIQFSAPL